MKLSEKKLKELKNNKISIKDLNKKYFVGPEYGPVEVDNILKLLDEDICSFKEIVDRFKSIYKFDSLLKNKELFEELIENNRSSKDDLRYLLNEIETDDELHSLNENTILLKHIVDKDILSFKKLIDDFKLLNNEYLFEELIQNNRLSKDYLRYLLNRIDTDFELNDLCYNTPLIKYILNEFVLSKELVDRLNRIFENDKWCKDQHIHTIFDRIEYSHKNNEEILKLIELNKYVCSFDLIKDQKLELYELIQNNEIALNRLTQLIDNHLESNYDFESLISYLKKKEKKNVLNI